MRSATTKVTKPQESVYSLRADREKLERLMEIAAAEHRTLAQKLRVMIDAEIEQHDKAAA